MQVKIVFLAPSFPIYKSTLYKGVYIMEIWVHQGLDDDKIGVNSIKTYTSLNFQGVVSVMLLRKLINS